MCEVIELKQTSYKTEKFNNIYSLLTTPFDRSLLKNSNVLIKVANQKIKTLKINYFCHIAILSVTAARVLCHYLWLFDAAIFNTITGLQFIIFAIIASMTLKIMNVI